MAKRWVAVGLLMVPMSVGLLALMAGANDKPTPRKSPADSSSGATGIVISDVIIQGNQRMSTEKIKALLRTRPEGEYNAAAVDDDVRDLYRTHQFSNIQTLHQEDGPGRIKVYFLFRDLPSVVKKVTFRRARHLKEDELRKLTGVRPGTPLNPNLNRQGCRRIEEQYEEQGRSFAHCKLVKGSDPIDTEVLYEITEGPKVQIKDIRFVGNTFANGAQLATQIKSSSRWFAFIGGAYNEKMAENDIEALRDYYRKSGYQDVKVSLETQRSGDTGETTLIFHIQEGVRTRPVTPSNTPRQTEEWLPPRVGQIRLIGNKRISTESILAHVPLFPGKFLTYANLQQAEQRLTELGLFVVDPKTGVHPTVTVISSESDGAFKDILIKVQEKPATEPTAARSH